MAAAAAPAARVAMVSSPAMVALVVAEGRGAVR